MTKKYLQRHLLSLEMQMETTWRFYPTQVRTAEINNTATSKHWRECGRKGASLHCWWDVKLERLLWKSVWITLKMLKINTPYDPAILFLHICPKNWTPYSRHLAKHKLENDDINRHIKAVGVGELIRPQPYTGGKKLQATKGCWDQEK